MYVCTYIYTERARERETERERPEMFKYRSLAGKGGKEEPPVPAAPAAPSACLCSLMARRICDRCSRSLVSKLLCMTCTHTHSNLRQYLNFFLPVKQVLF